MAIITEYHMIKTGIHSIGKTIPTEKPNIIPRLTNPKIYADQCFEAFCFFYIIFLFSFFLRWFILCNSENFLSVNFFYLSSFRK